MGGGANCSKRWLAAVLWSRRLQPKHPCKRIEPHPQVADVVIRPVAGVFIDTDQPVDQRRRPPAHRQPMGPITRMERRHRLIKPPSQARDIVRRRFGLAAAEDPFVDEQSGDRPWARRRQTHGPVMTLVEFAKRQTRLVLLVTDPSPIVEPAQRRTKPWIAGLAR